MIFAWGFFTVGIASLVLGIYTVVDASRYPEDAFRRTGSSKTTWQVVPILLIFFCGIGALVMGLVWLTSKREAVQAAAANLGYGYGQPYGGPSAAPPWTPPPMPQQSPPPPSTPPPPPPPPAEPPPPGPPSPQ